MRIWTCLYLLMKTIKKIEGLIGVGVKHFEEIEKENKKMI